MELRQKIENEIKRLETDLENVAAYQEIKRLLKELDTNPVYLTIQSLKRVLSDNPSENFLDYKILNIDRAGMKRGKIAKQLNLKDTSHYKEMLDFIEAFLEDSDPRTINDIFQVVTSANYEVGGKKPAYTLSALLSQDPRFTATNKGWILTKKVNADAV